MEPSSSVVMETEEDLSKSALADNIERKGKNAYYFAHAHKATGPKWDGKIEPKLLSRQSSSLSATKVAAFDSQKSNIASYAFCDEETKVKLYVNLEGVGERCVNDEDVSLDYTSSSLCLLVRNYDDDANEKCLRFGKLHGPIESASFKKKKDRIIVTLVKSEEIEWSAICAKGSEFL